MRGSPGERRYANFLEVGYTADEFVVDFGQYHEGDPEVHLHTGIVMTPTVAKELARLLAESLGRWECGRRGEAPETP
jgi:Protein of unknown function (DUF3467)